MSKQEDLDKLKQKIESDTSLPLRNSATQLVFGVGNPDTEILFIGEAPGFYEDQKGEPFVGAAGQLLDKSLLEIKVKRTDVFITNVVMYRPPNNRDPLPEELSAFDPFVKQIVEIIAPTLIVTLGRFSMAKFLESVKITQVHGKLYKRKFGQLDIFVIPMFHPAAALRSPQVHDLFKKDFVRLPKALEKIQNL